LLNGDIPGTLLTINDIIEKGFDGQHFLIGFGEHLRNLMVCKDPATAALLETAPSIRARYVEQSARCSTGFLLKTLDINNRCDLNYKTSNNKRLHLELSLMQMCSLSVTESPASPHRETARLRTEPIPASRKEPLPASSPGPAPSSPMTPPLTTSKVQPQPSEKHIPRSEKAKIKDIPAGFTSALSIKKPVSKNSGVEQKDEPEKIQSAEPFTQSDLGTAWAEFAEKQKDSSPHLWAALRNYRPGLLPDWQIEFILDNKLLAEELGHKKGELSEFLRVKLNNSNIQIVTKIAETSKETRPYTDKDKFEKMAEKNPQLRNLREELDLEIEY
jgi:DNA polymerase-3 subunit gamma/tau